MSLYELDVGYDQNLGDDSDDPSNCKTGLTVKISQKQ